MASKLQKLLDNNKQWVQSKLDKDGSFFDTLSSKHTPEFLWIGCSDARMPANALVGTEAGEMFVHRNVGNVVSHNDANIRAVIGYAVEALGVKHIIVAGHYGCGACKASLSSQNFGTVDNWVHQIRNVIRENDDELSKLEGEAKEQKLIELNMKTQLRNLSETPMVQTAWKNGQDLTLHGWIYNIHDGLLNDIYQLENAEQAKALETSTVVKNS